METAEQLGQEFIVDPHACGACKEHVLNLYGGFCLSKKVECHPWARIAYKPGNQSCWTPKQYLS